MDDTIEQKITERNLKIAEKFVVSVSEVARGILLTGSNAWGANYAVNQNSDIDLLVVGDDIQTLERIIAKYISDGLLRDSEQARFEIFKELFLSGEVEMFSLIADYTGVAVSIDFLDTNTLRKIS